MRSSRLTSLLRAALVAALAAASALFTVPIGPVPVTLQTLVVAVAVLVLSTAEAAASLGLYIALGAVGLPVFSGGGAGVGALLGPTGGFIVGFAVGAVLGSATRVAISARRGGQPALAADVAGLAVMLLSVYALGALYFSAVTDTSLVASLAVAVMPFVLVDGLKAAVALLIARSLRVAGLAAR